MRTKKFLALLLVLVMIVSLFPAAALAEDVEDENLIEEPAEDPSPVDEEEPVEPEEELPAEPETPEEDLEAVVPEEDEAEPEADPVLYDLWVCGVQVTSANKQSIDGGYMVRFDSGTNTLTIYTNKFFKDNSTQLYGGALIYSALPNLTVNLQLKTDVTSKYISSDAAQSLIYVENGSLTIVTKDGTTPQLKSNSATVGIDVHGGSFNLNGNLYMSSSSEQIGINVPDGAVTLNGNLDVNLDAATADACIFAESGLTSTGSLNVDSYKADGGYGIKVMNGPVTINGEVTYISAEHTGIYCGNGDVNITGVTSFSINHNEQDELSYSSGVYAANGSITIGAIDLFGGANWLLYANGPIHITEAFNFVNEGDMLGGNGIKSTQGGIVIDGNAAIEAANCIVSESEEGVLVRGDATLTATGRYAIQATNGPITVNGNLDARGAGYTAVSAKGDITVGGNAYAQASTPSQFPEFPGNAIESTDGSINVTGNLTCYCTKNPAYAKNDIRVGGNALTSAAVDTTSVPGDFGIKAENGEITVGGTLTCNGKAAYSVWAGTSVTVEKDVTITNAAEGSVGMYANGFLNFVSGKWDVTAATAALQAGNGIEIPEGFGVTLPGRGFVAVVDSLNTVTESDGTTVAAHAIIEAKEYTEGYYLIGPDWTLTGIVPTDKFEVNPNNANEYILKTTLAVGDKIKVVKLTDGAITEWYPDGVGNEYTVNQAHAGTVNIYFKTTYDSAWSEFGGFFYIEHVHDWGKPTWTWSEDLSSATATFVCAGDPSHTVTLDAVVTVERWSDCECGTYVDYTATVEFEGKTYKGYKGLEYPNGHPWGEPTWEWAEDYSSATATFVCENDASHTKTVNATITSETNGRETVYTATVELDGLTYIDTKTVVSAAVTVTFDAGEGTVEPTTKEVNPGEAIDELPVPTREGGWKFIGWFTAPAESYLTAGQGTQVTAETTVDEDTTVYAHWRLPGDINGDGKVNNKDVTRLQKYLKGEAVEVVAFNLDTNGDGNVSNKDLTRLQRFVKGETVELN